MYVPVKTSPSHRMTCPSLRSALGDQKKRKKLHHNIMGSPAWNPLPFTYWPGISRTKNHLVSYHCDCLLTVACLQVGQLRYVLWPHTLLCSMRRFIFYVKYMFVSFYYSICFPTDVDHVNNVSKTWAKKEWARSDSKPHPSDLKADTLTTAPWWIGKKNCIWLPI